MKKLLTLAVVVFALSACAGLTGGGDFNHATFAGWLAQGEFERAARSLNKLPTEHADELASYQREYSLAASDYASEMLAKAAKEQRDNHWLQAQATYKLSLDALPDNESLQNAFFRFLAKKQSYIDELERSDSLARARSLPAELKKTNELLAIYTRDRKLKSRQKRLKTEALDLSVYLDQEAETAFEAGKYITSRNYDKLVLSLVDSKTSRERVDEVNAYFNQKARAQARSRSRQKQQKFDRTWQEYQAALNDADFIAARSLLNDLERLELKQQELATESDRLDSLMRLQAEELISRGKQEYTRGQLQEALEAWRAALLLVPGNQELLAQIKRAETFHANYKRLSN